MIRHPELRRSRVVPLVVLLGTTMLFGCKSDETDPVTPSTNATATTAPIIRSIGCRAFPVPGTFELRNVPIAEIAKQLGVSEQDVLEGKLGLAACPERQIDQIDEDDVVEVEGSGKRCLVLGLPNIGSPLPKPPLGDQLTGVLCAKDDLIY